MHHKHSRARHGRRFARDEHREGEQRSEHREGERRGGHHRHGRGGLGRFFAHGDLRLVILHLVETKPRYGYEIIKTIEELVAGAYSPSPGVIYPTLTLLEELGYVTVSAEDGKKLHTITEQGRAFLAANRPAVELLLARMAETNRTRGGGPAPQVLRAMENLKLALHLRLSRGPVTEEQIAAITTILDSAATGVERA